MRLPDETLARYRDKAWRVIAEVRDAAPREPDDAPTDAILDALVDSGLLDQIVSDAHLAGLAAGRADAETMRGDVHHHLNPAIGWLRLRFQQATGADPFAIPDGDNARPDTTGLPGTVSIDTGLMVSTLRKMRSATDAADAALGEEPIRVRIAPDQDRPRVRADEDSSSPTVAGTAAPGTGVSRASH
ncbi:hypothetical protein [Nocardioides pakistanensis]